MKHHSRFLGAVLLILGWGCRPAYAASVPDIVIPAGSDYLSIKGTSLVQLDGLDENQDPLPEFTFVGLPINPRVLGNTSMVVRRTQDIVRGSATAECASGVPAEILALSLKSAVPLKFGGTSFQVVVTLPRGTRPHASSGYVNRGDLLLGFLCAATFPVTAVLTPVGGGTTRSVSGTLGITVDADISTNPPLGAVIFPGPPGDLRANWHNPLPAGSVDVFLRPGGKFPAEPAVGADAPVPYRGTFVISNAREVHEIHEGDRFGVRFVINHNARDTDPRSTGAFRTNGPDIFELQPPAGSNLTLEQVGGFTQTLTRDFAQGSFIQDSLTYRTFLTGTSVTSPFFPGRTFIPNSLGMAFVSPEDEDRITDSGLGQTLTQQIRMSLNGLFRAEFFPFQSGFILFADGRGHRVDVASVLENVRIAPEANATGKLQIVRGLPQFNAVTQHFEQTVTLQNDSDSAFIGPMWLVLDSLGASATLVNKTGNDVPSGSPYVLLDAGPDDVLSRREGVSVVLEFVSPTGAGGITYTPRVLALQPIP